MNPGDTLGPYTLISPLGEGGMGEVWKARDTRLDRTVALKVSKAEFSERFEREARAVAALNHPKICTLHDVGPNYLVMEYVDGTPLAGPLPVGKAVEYAGQILDALDAAHRQGITHRDLKPANILVTKQGIKLLDFGLAKQAAPLGGGDARPTEALTSQGQILGTLQYMAPEQLQGKDADARSDIFAFGCVLYEMLSGKHAFEGSSPASVIAAILERQPSPLDVTPPLDRIVRTCLAKDPDDRFQTAREVKLALEWSASAPAQTGAVTADGKARPWPWIVAAAVATLAALALAGSWAVHAFRQVPPVEQRAIQLALNPPDDGQFVFGNNMGGLALSPDGRTAAYVASVGGKAGLWIKPLDGASAELLPGTEDIAGYPFWSPDNRTLAYFTLSKLRRVEIRGGAPQTICIVVNGRGGAWTSDGRILFGTLASGLFVVPDSSGTASPLTTIDTSRGENSHRWPQVLSGGRFLYWVGGNREVQGVYAASFARPAEGARLMLNDANALYAPGGDGKDYLLWLRGGTLMAQELDLATLALTGERRPVADPVTAIRLQGAMNVAASRTGLLLYSAFNTRGQFTWIDRVSPGKRPLDVVGEPGEYGVFRLSPDGLRIATSQDRPDGSDLWLLEVERGVANKFTNNSTNSIYPVWSHDGRTIVFTLSPSRNLFRKDVSGAGSEQPLTQSPNPKYAGDWSRDGRWLMYHEAASGTQRDLWVLPTTPGGRPSGDAKSQVYLRTPSNESLGRFSPEPSLHWVAYQSDESGSYEVYIDSFPQAGDRKRISTNGGSYPQWGAGGHELFYVSPDFKLMVVDLKLTANSVEPSVPRELFRLPAVDTGYSPYDTARDGRRFLVRATPEHEAAKPLTVIVNWPALLKEGRQ